MKFCLDAGHSGTANPYIADGSTIGSEAQMAWRLHEKLRDRLQAAGAQVVCTRASLEEEMELLARGQASRGCDLFLSLHSNAGSGTADYPLACCMADGSTDAIGLTLARAAGETMGTTQSARIWKRDYQTGAGEMLLHPDSPNFGKPTARKDYYGVLRGAAQVGVPGVLLECSFHSNPAMARWLTREDNLDRLADALCSALTGHFGLTVPDWKAKYTDLLARHDKLIGELTALTRQYEGGASND